MRSPEELDAIDWSSLYHAYGEDGSDVPDWIRVLYSDDADRVDKVLSELFNSVLHQGSVYPATVAAVPFLAHVAVHAVHGRAHVLALLAGTGGHGPEPQPGDEAEGCAKVGAEVSGLLHLLGDDDPQVRRQTVRVARRATGTTVPVTVRELITVYERDPAAVVRAEALTVLTRIDTDPRSAHRRLHDALTDPVAAVRAVAALELLEQAQAPYPADLVGILAVAGGRSEFAVDQLEFFPGIGDTDSRVADVLAEDADAAVAVARSWIAQGDAGGRGSRRAMELSDTWRDRENDTIALLTAALPHEKSPWDLFALLGGIVRWLPGATHVDPALGDNLLPHAVAGTSTAEQAQLALGRLGDERLLTVVPGPDPAALAALAATTDRLDHQRLALRHPAACPDELLTRLTPDTARLLWPDLLGLLRHRPTPSLACRFGDWGIEDSELIRLLDETARSDDDELATAAAVSAARLGAAPDPALRLLERRLGDNGWSLEEAGRLGPVAAPLLPLLTGYLADGYEWTRMRAAEAHWRITGDASKAVPVLTTLAGPLPVGVRALQTLALIGPPFPPHLQPHLRHWSTAERRQVSSSGLLLPGPELHPMDNQLRETARQMLA
ncbi:hypothetical protein ACFY4H_25150 [Streptomyces althioticus]|uniref:hypothetical protein n=1 Tax=Streptomyces althioticus TaxID=83380 RepID=UPI0036B83926